jgi:uncharacterized membrane protein YdbT with pleckstrin-like domain
MDERVVVRLRAHSSRLVGPALALLVIAPGTGVLLGRAEGWVTWLVAGTAAVLVVRVVLWPFLSWWSTTYELTTRRVSLRWGVLARHGRDVPWRSVVDVLLDRSVRQRLTGCGTVVLLARGAATDREPAEVALTDVPQPERLWRTAADLAEERPGLGRHGEVGLSCEPLRRRSGRGG